MSAAGLALALWMSGFQSAAIVVLVGGLVASGLVFTAPRQPGALGPTTPLTVLVLLGGFVSLWLGSLVLNGPGPGPLRVALVSPIALLGAAALAGNRRRNLPSLASTLVLAIGALSLRVTPTTAVVGSIAAVLLAGLAHLNFTQPETAE